MNQSRSVVVTTKNEGPFLLEWIAYHRLIGFDNLVVFANDCEDGSDHLLSALDQAGLIRYFDNSDIPEGLPADPQNRAYRRAFAMDHVRQSEWVLVIDADEFFNIHAGDGTLDALFAATGPADVISAPWCVFGNGGVIPFHDDLVMTQYNRAAPKDVQVSFRHFGLKTLFRPGPMHRLGVHRPFLTGEYKRPEKPLTWLNGSGKNVTSHYREKGWAASPSNVGYDLCQINHYMIKANELFLMKRYRGTANSVDADRINFDYYDSFNSNHTSETTLHRWAGPVQAEIDRIKTAHPQIAMAHEACINFFRNKIGSLVTGLVQSNPEVHEKLLSPAVVAESISKDVKWLEFARVRAARAAKSPTAPATKPDRPANLFKAHVRIEGAAEVHPPMAPPPATDEPVKKESKNKSKKDKAVGGKTVVGEPDDVAPNWLADLRRTDHRRGFYQSEDTYAAHFTDRGDKTLIISFDNLSNVKDPALNREGWGYGFYKAENWSHLGILSFVTNWYRDEALFDYLEGLAANGFFTRFGKIVLTGTSMGAYAASAFSSLCPGATVLAFSPQSTLANDLVPWETRFKSGRKADWSGRFRDAPTQVGDAKAVFVFYDPMFEPDKQHAERYQGANVYHLKTWFTGHKSALFLRRAELLKPMTRAAVDGTLDDAAFYLMYRKRRNLPWYINGLTDTALKAGHKNLVKNMAVALGRDGRPHLSRAIMKRTEG